MPYDPDRPWREEQVRALGFRLLGFGLLSGFALGVCGTLLVWRPW